MVEDVDFESLNPAQLGVSEVQLQMTVQASDGGGLTSTVPVTVTVTDENDNSPVFFGTPFSASLRENSAPGVEVTRVSLHTAAENVDTT